MSRTTGRGFYPSQPMLQLFNVSSTHPAPTLESSFRQEGPVSKAGPRKKRFIGLFLPLAAAFATIQTDFRMIFERDPSARHPLEVLFCYPGFHALVCHRLAHGLHQQGIPVIPRLISSIARWLTGVEIHSGAVLGKGTVIDHGMGVVIGETAIVGDYALIYQGVTLGGTGKDIGKRHPTLGDYVVVGAGASVLGNIHIGDHARIGAGSVVLKRVPSHCTAVGVPSRILCRHVPQTDPLEHGQLPNTESIVIQTLLQRIERLEHHLHTLPSRRSYHDAQIL